MPPANFPVTAAAFVVVALLLIGGVECKSLTLTLERVNHNGVELSQLLNRDRIRHGRFLQQKQSIGVVDLPVQGTFNPFLVGLYYTRIQLGTPPQEFYVQIDTGSDVLWVSCNPCNGCPTSTGLDIDLHFFDPTSSSTASMISCSDQRCALGADSSDSGCINQNQCGYTFQYGDGSGTSGYYVSDSMVLDSIVGNTLTSNHSAPVIFGCSTSETGGLTKPDRAVDGIFGFGQQALSVISQLASQGITPNVFSHCLKGDDNGGGILVLGEIVEPNIVYTPLVPSQPHYNVNLESIVVNGRTVLISSSVFATSDNSGTIIDSGTTLAYLAEEAYDPFFTALTQSLSQSVSPTLYYGNQCYITSSSVSESFPPISLNFAGGASLRLMPQDYLFKPNPSDSMWCLGFQKIQGQEITILGDVVLKDKIVVYDLVAQRIGWANYDCSSTVNVSTSNSTGTIAVDPRRIGNNGSAHYELYKLIPSAITAILFHIAFFVVFSFL